MEEPQVAWRVPVKVPVAKLVVAGLVVVIAILGATGWWHYLAAAAVVAGLVGWAARDRAAPVRLAADPTGLTVVSGFARRTRLEWSRVERVRVDTRRRSRMLEVDVGDHLYLFSRYDIDADLDRVADRLEALRTAATG